MKNRKRYGRKIKRTRAKIYRRRKTRGQKTLAAVLLVIAVAAVGFLGYCLGKPLLEFIEKSSDTGVPEWTPPVQTSAAPEQPPEESAPETPEAPEEPPEEEWKIKAVTASDTVLQNQTALRTFAAHARSQGYNTVVLELKDGNGYFRYASPAAAKRSEGLIKSTLTAAEIAGAFAAEEMRVIGTVSVLADNAGCGADMDMCYKIINEKNTSWLDFDYDPPIFWADPAKEATLSYLREVADELSEAGIAVMLKELVFPALDEYDRRYLAPPYFEESRSAMLLPYVSENTPVEMSAADIIGESPGRTAELLREREFTGSGGTIAVRISRESFPPEDGFPAGAAGLAEDVLARVRAKVGRLSVLPVIESKGFSESELEAVKALLDGGYIID